MALSSLCPVLFQFSFLVQHLAFASQTCCCFWVNNVAPAAHSSSPLQQLTVSRLSLNGIVLAWEAAPRRVPATWRGWKKQKWEITWRPASLSPSLLVLAPLPAGHRKTSNVKSAQGRLNYHDFVPPAALFDRFRERQRERKQTFSLTSTSELVFSNIFSGLFKVLSSPLAKTEISLI